MRSFALVLALTGSAGSAVAETRSYAVQCLIPDGIADVTFAIAAGTKSSTVAWVGAAFVAGCPLVHAIHGHNTRAKLSILGRLLMPLLGFGLGAGLAYQESDDDMKLAGAAGAGLGLALVQGIDALVATDEVADSVTYVHLRVAPHFVGLAGTF